MHLYFRPLDLLLFVLFWAYVSWTWLKWLRTDQKDTPKWRAVAASAGLFCATVSTALGAFLFIHAAITGGYPFYHSVELFCIRVGGLTALLGIAAAITGKGKARLPVAVISTLNLLLWFVDAVSQ
jgi:hypothetical protein